MTNRSAGAMVSSVLTASIVLVGAPVAGAERDADSLPHFSFFVTSTKAMQELSGSLDGFGGDLRFGETGPGAGLRGADKICTTIAEESMPGSSAKQWRAFLSVSADENGKQVDAIDRIGEGPWYDRLGRLVSPTKADLVATDRPENGDPAIRDDLPNEDGVPNHQPDPGLPQQENHHTLTGSGKDGRLYPDAGGLSSTCSDWTTADGRMEDGTDISTVSGYLQLRDLERSFGSSGRPRIGLSWPRAPRPGAEPRFQSWISHFNAVGCAPGGQITPSGKDRYAATVGLGGGYGGIYCFALEP